MFRVRTIALVGAAFILPAADASAADMPPLPMPTVIEKLPIVQEFASNWYLRGDVGYRWNRTGGVSAAIAPDPTDNTIDSSYAFGGGAGYKMNWLRVDGTIDYGFDAKYKGDTVIAAPDYSLKINTLTALINFYFDLGTWSGWTPYFGGGLGGSRVSTSGFTSALTPGDSVDNAAWNFAWALMAGASYNIAPNLLLDVGYRYLNVGDAVSGLDSLSNQLTVKDLIAHEARIGLRWSM